MVHAILYTSMVWIITGLTLVGILCFKYEMSVSFPINQITSRIK